MTSNAMFDAPKPAVDYTLTIHEKDGLGCYYVKSSIPGLFLYGPDLRVLLDDVPLAVAKLRAFNGDERSAVRRTTEP